MNIRRTRSWRGQSGLTLIECLVYMAVLIVVMACSTAIFFQSWTDSRALHRNATDIIGALHVGDQWRSDLRAATGLVQVAESNGVEQILIPMTNGETYYTFFKGRLFRQAAGDPAYHVWLDNVKSSHMQFEPREKIAAWRWELELKSSIKNAKFHPLFTFEAVAGGANAQ
jgi:Tfp pilus assembly protein FimT